MNNGVKILWLVSLGAAFFLGYSINSTKTTDKNNNTQIIEQTKFNDTHIQSQDNIPLEKATELEKTNATIIVKPDLDSLLSNLENLLSGKNSSFDIASLAQAYSLIEELSEDELLATLNLMKGKLNKFKNAKLLSLLVGRLATFEPLAAANFIRDNVDSSQVKMRAMKSVMSSWAKDDPISAYYWYMDPNNNYASDNTFSSDGLLSIFKGLAKQDIDDAFTKLTDLDNSEMNTRIAAIGISQALENKEDFILFIERSDELDDKNIKNSIISNWVLKNPLETIEWSESIIELKQQKRMQSNIFMNWSRADATKAADWYLGMANESEKNLHAGKIVAMWDMREPNAALNWLDQQTSFDTQEPMVKLLKSTYYFNTKFAMDNLERLNSDKDKIDVSYGIYQSLKMKSTKKSAEFLLSSPYKEGIENKKINVENKMKKNCQA